MVLEPKQVVLGRQSKFHELGKGSSDVPWSWTSLSIGVTMQKRKDEY